MKLPQATEIDELNRVLLAVVGLSVPRKGCTTEAVIALCSSFTFGGRPVDHKRTLLFCSFAGLLSVTKGRARLTESGREFLALNPSHSYELTGAQKRFVAQRLILSGPWSSQARDLFLAFAPNYQDITYELAISDNPLPLRFRSAVHLLRELGVLLEADGVLTVSPEYVASISQLLADRHGITEAELARALRANRKLGALAEDAVVGYERKRLRALGRHAEASLVRRISQLDVSVGYDIESFDGDKPLFTYDRFIEVKASQKSELHFCWTRNEYRVAAQYGSRYWIYFIGCFERNRPGEIAPIMIRDPASRLSQIAQLQVEASGYIVKQCEELVLEQVDHQSVRGVLL